MELCNTDTGFSSSLILISFLLHYSFKAGDKKKKKQRKGADYKKVDQGKLGGRAGEWGRVPELSSPKEQSAKSALNPRTINTRVMTLSRRRREKRRARKQLGG